MMGCAGAFATHTVDEVYYYCAYTMHLEPATCYACRVHMCVMGRGVLCHWKVDPSSEDIIGSLQRMGLS